MIYPDSHLCPAEQRGQQALAALAEEDAEVEACVDAVRRDIAKLDAEGTTMAEHDWDGFS